MYDSWAKYYDFVNDQSFGVYLNTLTDRTLSFIDQLVPKTAKILDLGAGTGRLSIPLATRSHRVTVVELSSQMADQLAWKAQRAQVCVEIVNQSIHEYRPTSAEYDLALCVFTVLNHLTDDETLGNLAENLCFVLKPGGHFLCEIARDELFRPTVYRSEEMVREIDVSQHSSDLYRYCESTTGVMRGEQFSYENRFEMRNWRDDEIRFAFESSGLRFVGRCSAILGCEEKYLLFQRES